MKSLYHKETGGRDAMEKPHRLQHPHLFTVQVWEEEIATNQTEWRGKVQLLTSKEVCYFRNLETLASILLKLLSNLDDRTEANE
jgi:hypothetical protein